MFGRNFLVTLAVFRSLDIAFIFANSADPDEMPPDAAFHLGLYYFAKVPVYRYPE